ncbi:MAG: serine dehydratase subunit alpha family protein [Oscillospiraceae bacterium]|nr:serine dehydratase subunit alpha family protein [Oscillospiraceae bacterium]
MERNDVLYQQYIAILNEELRPAMGCTEPIALAYAGAKAKGLLGRLPEKILVEVSGNIIKNVKSVVVPNTGGLHGIAAAVCAGVAVGKPELQLEVISCVTEEERRFLAGFLKQTPVEIQPSTSDLIFDIDLHLFAGDDVARVRIVNHHTNIVHMSKNGQVLLDLPVEESSEDHLTDKSCLCMEKIVEFADALDIEDVRHTVGRQIRCNMDIAREGIQNNWGANIGSVILRRQGQSVDRRAAAYAAAGSDARMSGCEKPVIILSGSGNQGITASVPVAVFAEEMQVSEELLFKAVALSDLVTIHQKTGIGRLSAYCGAISAGCGAGAGIAYLHGGRFDAVAHTVVNAIAILSGTICDGAKPSCAAKIAAAVDAGILGYDMYLEHQQFYGGDGIITKGVDQTLTNVGRLAREGMRETDRTILKIMLDDPC